MAVSREDVVRALRDVVDPELGLSIVDLGLVYDIAIDGGGVRILMSLTAPDCPLHATIDEWVRRAVATVDELLAENSGT